MNTKTRYLMVGILLITLSLATVLAPLQAQDSPEPAATEDPCIAIIEAGMQPVDDIEAGVQPEDNIEADVQPEDNIAEATEEPTLYSCLDAFVEAETNATPAPNTALLDESSTSRSAAGADNAQFHSITVMNRTEDHVARFWLTWHVPGTGALVALGSGPILAGLSGTLAIPSGAVGIGIRVENIFGNGTWAADDNCHFAFDDAHEDRTIAYDALSLSIQGSCMLLDNF